MRPLNLVIIAFTMYAMRWGVLLSVAQGFDVGAQLQLPEWKFGLATTVMVLLAAAGNIINDWFDEPVDRINKPNRVIIGELIPRNVAFSTYHALNLLAVGIGIFLAYHTGSILVGALPVLMAIALWFYSSTFKGSIWIGNFIVALLVGIVPLWTGLFEIPLLFDVLLNRASAAIAFAQTSWWWLFAFAMFAFWLTLIREAQKDLEDVKGDQFGGFKTLPVSLGIRKTKVYLCVLYGVLLIGLGLAMWLLNTLLVPGMATIIKTLIILILITPSVYGCWLTIRGTKNTDFRKASTISKWVMVAGILLGTFMPMWYA